MANRTKAFRNGHRDPNGIIYSTQRTGDTIYADAYDPADDSMSSAHFKFDPDTGSHEVVPGTLDLHPDHAKKDVGRVMRRIVNSNF